MTKRRPGEPRRFVVEVSGDVVSGRPEDVSRAILAKLRSSGAEPDREVDLHGLPARDARQRLARELREARAAGERCVLVVHGRGIHSESRPVLRDALPSWLQEAPQSELVLAFATAPRALGGAGATLVWIRRVREPAVSSAANRRRGEQDET
ncbi:MAG TPA: Smr/MutS family protein [Myxococcota bacterium]|nr:Smr/MutS family protein [Myxococcota bacterium]